MEDNIYRVECKIGERLYVFSCDKTSPISEVKDALFQFIKYIGQIEDQATKSNHEEMNNIEVLDFSSEAV